MIKPKIEYAPGCFDEISDEITQEELDELLAEIERLVDSGEFFEMAIPIEEADEQEVLNSIDRVKNQRH